MTYTIPESASSTARVREGLLFGLAAGLTFSLAAWGIDAIQLAAAAAIFPFLKLVIGMIPCILAGMLIGLIASRFRTMLILGILWALAGVFMAWWAGHVPYTFTTFALSYLDPSLLERVNYPYIALSQGRTGLIMVISGGAGLIAGLLQMNFTENARYAYSSFARVLTILVWSVAFIAAGLFCDAQINKPLRQPVIAMNTLIAYVQENRNNASQLNPSDYVYLSTLDPVKDLVDKPHSIILKDYDDSFELNHVLVDFSGTWVNCSFVSNNRPGYCVR